MSDLIKIAVDAMGGDGSPKKIIDGIIHSNKSNKKNFFKIFGNKIEIEKLIKNKLNDEKIKSIKLKIRNNCSPKHVPAKIIKVPEIPRTKSGKIVELAVRQIINGEKINNKEAIANPESLKFFEKLSQLKL